MVLNFPQDALSVHCKMSLTHSIVTLISKQVSNKSQLALAPALVETYSRLLIYSEIESLGIKGLLNQLLPQVFKQNSWGFLHMLLEMFSYRLHHIQAQFRLSLLSHLQMGINHLNLFHIWRAWKCWDFTSKGPVNPRWQAHHGLIRRVWGAESGSRTDPG